MATGTNTPTTGPATTQGNTGGANNPPNPPVSASARRTQATTRNGMGWACVLLLVLIGVIAALGAAKIFLVGAQADKAVEIATAVSDRVDGLEKKVGKAQGSADRANARQSAMVGVQNGQLKVMMADIRKDNPAFELCSKSDAEINGLLTNGVWDIEPKIMAEDARIKSVQAEVVKNTATQLETVTAVATQALDAGATAISAVGQIADQPNRLLGKSVKTGTKKTIKEQLAEYRQKYGK